MTVFRITAHKLEIETCRYVQNNKAIGNKGRIPRHDRFCTFCYEENKTKVMGDEVHAILNCTHFNDIRERFLVST